MGKKGRNRHKQNPVVPTPSFESPVCPACGKANHLVEEAGLGNDPLYECTGCWVRFMLEDSLVEIEEDDDDAVAACNINSGVAARDFNNVEPMTGLKCAICQGKGRQVCQRSPEKDNNKKQDTREYQTEPLFGEVEELTDAMAKRP